MGDDFEKLNTAARFRLLSSYLGIPNEIPEELQNLTKLIGPGGDSSESIKDAPALLVKIRNSIIHPKDTIKKRCEKAKVSLESVQWEAVRLYRWYSNLVLLKVMGYTGTYAKRLLPFASTGDVAQVPWFEDNQERNADER